MIAHLRGKLMQKEPARVVIDVHGVGYEVCVPVTTFGALPDLGTDISIDIHTHVREDVIALYGFSTRRERIIFEMRHSRCTPGCSFPNGKKPKWQTTFSVAPIATCN